MSISVKDDQQYQFGEFTLDTERGALLRHGQAVRLRPQSFEVLRLLVAKNGRLVSKSELHSAVWGDKVVTDDSLAQCLIDIRKAFGDADRKMIRTVPRRGYVFDAKVVTGRAGSTVVRSSRKAGTRAVVTAALLAVVVVIGLLWQFNLSQQRISKLPSDRSIAVLPFVDLSESQDLQYLGDGLSEDILNSLAQYRELRVIARTSSFSFAGENQDIATIRDALNVAYVLEGSVRREGELLKITAHFIDSSDSSHIWSQTFERPYSALQSIKEEIATGILLHLLPDSELIGSTLKKRNVSAEQSMLLARHLEREVRDQLEVDEDVLAEAIHLYRDATKADPDSALAHSRLAGALLYQGDLKAAQAPIFKALTINSDLSEVQDTLGKYNWLSGLPGAGNAWKKAVELNPNNADALNSYGYWYWMQGYADGAEEYFRRALELDPLSLSRYAALGNFYAQQAIIGETHKIIDRVETLFKNPAAYRLIARMLELIGEVDRSIAWIIRARDLEPDNSEHTAALAELYVDLGDFDTALSLEPEPSIGLLIKTRRYQEAIAEGELLMIDEPGDVYLRYLLAFAYNATGKSASAVRILRTSGLPDTVMPEARQAIDIEAFVTLIDALDAEGDTLRSHELATWWTQRQQVISPNWWVHFYMACPLLVTGREEEALVSLEQIAKSPRLPWNFLLRDSRCLQYFTNEPRYQAMLLAVDERRAKVLSRVPATLLEFGVSLRMD